MCSQMVTEKDMDIARLTAAKAVLLQAVAQKAWDGEQEWAMRWLKRMDQAMLDVKPEDLREFINPKPREICICGDFVPSDLDEKWCFVRCKTCNGWASIVRIYVNKRQK